MPGRLWRRSSCKFSVARQLLCEFRMESFLPRDCLSFSLWSKNATPLTGAWSTYGKSRSEEASFWYNLAKQLLPELRVLQCKKKKKSSLFNWSIPHTARSKKIDQTPNSGNSPTFVCILKSLISFSFRSLAYRMPIWNSQTRWKKKIADVCAFGANVKVTMLSPAYLHTRYTYHVYYIGWQ